MSTAQQSRALRDLRLGAGDIRPASLQKAWWKDMLELVKDPGKLDSILNSLSSVAQHLRRTAFGAVQVSAK